MYTQKNLKESQGDTCASMFIAALFTEPHMEAAQVFIDG
jgi:hypothetical protein